MRKLIYLAIMCFFIFEANSQNTYFEMDQVSYTGKISGLKFREIGSEIVGLYHCTGIATSFYSVLTYDKKGVKKAEHTFRIPYSDDGLTDFEITNQKDILVSGFGTNSSGYLNYTFCFDSLGKRKWGFADSIFISDTEILSDSVAVGVLNVKKHYKSFSIGAYFVWVNIKSGLITKSIKLDSLLALNTSINTNGFRPREIKKSGNKILLNCYNKNTSKYFIKVISEEGNFVSQSILLEDNSSVFFVSRGTYYLSKTISYTGYKKLTISHFDLNHKEIFSYTLDTSYLYLISDILINKNGYSVIVSSPRDSLFNWEDVRLVWLNGKGQLFRECLYKFKAGKYDLNKFTETFDGGIFLDVYISDWLDLNSAIMKTTSFGEIKNSEVTSQCTDYRVGVEEIKPLNRPNQLKVYPNPTTNQVNIASELLIKTLTLYSITGEEKLKLSPNKKQINLSLAEFASGVYYVVAETEWGAERVKVVKW